MEGPPIDLHLVRHGESINNAKNLITGRSDVPLSRRGHLQAFALGLQLSGHYDSAWVSNLRRSRHTFMLATTVRHRDLRSLLIADPRLDERSLGTLEGKPTIRIEAYTNGDLSYAPTHGESYLDLTKRILSFLVDLRQSTLANRRLVISTHAGPLRIFIAILEDLCDPKAILGMKLHNVQGYRGTLTALHWPLFLRSYDLAE
jgi:probable phosphoglycerate mutase